MATDRTAPPPKPPTPTLDAMMLEIAQVAKKFGVANIIVLAIDPRTAHPQRYGDPKVCEAMRSFVAQKFGLFDEGETGWSA